MSENKFIKCYTPIFRVSFPNVFEAKSFQDSVPKYQITMLFPKSLFEPVAETDSEDIKIQKQKILQMRKLAIDCVKEKWGDDQKKKAAIRVKMAMCKYYPFRDGDVEKTDLDGYAGHYFAVASSKRRPGIIDQKFKGIDESRQDDFYAGCFCMATINAYAFATAGNTGVAFGLQNIMKVADGESFSGGGLSAQDDFAEFKPVSQETNGAQDDFDDFLN